MQPNPVDMIRGLMDEERFNEAWMTSRDFIEADPENVELLRLAARAGQKSSKLEDAYADMLMVRSLVDDPADEKLLHDFECEMIGVQAQHLGEQHRYAEAEAKFEEARQLAPDVPELYSAMGHMEFGRGDLERAIEYFRKGAYLGAPSRPAHDNLLLAMMHSDRVDEQTLYEEHLAWARRIVNADQTADVPRPPIEDRDPNRILRLGFISGDFRLHPVAHFVLPLLQHYDRSKLHIICYDERPAPADDALAPVLRATADEWAPIPRASPAELFHRFRADKIDILFDLAVHSDHNSLPLFASRPVPMQMSWLGYVGTTGLKQVDYRITDFEIDPPGMSERYSTEKLLRLPEIFWCYSSAPDSPPVRELTEADASRPVRFGTATRSSKVSATCLDLWCRLLREVPEAQLVLADGPFKDEATRARWMEKFTSRGVDASRVVLEGGRTMKPYLEFLGASDIGLDTFPFNGGTTNCHTLYMGTPIVALRGKPGVGRVTASILKAVGLDDLIANTPDEWVAINAKLARDPARRAHLRRTLRQQVMTSALGDGPRFAAHFERVLRDAWRSLLAETA